MTLLGASSDAIDIDARLIGAVDGSDSGVEHSAELSTLAEAAWRRDHTLDDFFASEAHRFVAELALDRFSTAANSPGFG